MPGTVGDFKKESNKVNFNVVESVVSKCRMKKKNCE